MQFFDDISKMFGRAVFEVIEVELGQCLWSGIFVGKNHTITIIENPLAHSSIISEGMNTNQPIEYVSLIKKMQIKKN